MLPSGARLFFLAETPDSGSPRLEPAEERHARQVLRLAPGDELFGTLGRGEAWPLRVTGAGRDGLALEVTGEALREPPPGDPGASLPAIELAVALPRGSRAEAMLERLVQLGLAALTPLVCERVQGPRRELSPARTERLLRTARASLKQSHRLWLPELREPETVEQLVHRVSGSPLAVLDPRARNGLLTWCTELRDADRVVLAVGPEGGWTDAEAEQLRAGGARAIRLGPHVLRIETAAETAIGGLALALERAERLD